MQWYHDRWSTLRTRLIPYVFWGVLKIGARQLIHKVLVQIGTADQEQINPDRMHRNLLGRVSPARNEHSSQKRIIHAETTNFRAVYIQ